MSRSPRQHSKRPRPSGPNGRKPGQQRSAAISPRYLSLQEPALSTNIARFRAIHASAERQAFQAGMDDLKMIEYLTTSPV